MLRVRELLTLDEHGFELLIQVMQTNDAFNGVIRRSGNSIASKAPNEKSGVISTAIEQTDFLDSPPLARCLAGNDFSLTDLKREPVTVYLCLPAGRMATHSRWLRIIVNLAVEAMEREPAKPEHPVLFIMDEFAVLDHLSSVEKAAGQIAGFGHIVVSTACKSGAVAFARGLMKTLKPKIYIAPKKGPQFRNAIFFAHWFYHNIFVLKHQPATAIKNYRNRYKNPHDFVVFAAPR